MNKNFTERKTLWFSVLFLSLVLICCKKPDEVIGDNLVSDADKLGLFVTDTISLNLITEREDSLRSDELSVLQVGTYNDQETGTYNVSPSFQIRLSSLAVDFGSPAEIVVDSVRLLLAYDGSPSLGDSTFNLQLSVKELQTQLFRDSFYYTTSRVETIEQELLINNNISFNPTTPTVYNGDSLGSAVLILPIVNSFGEKIIARSGQSEVADNDNFVRFIKGLNVKAQAQAAIGQGFVFGINPASINSSLFIYYRNTVTQDTANFELLINNNSATLNSVEFDLNGSDAGNFLANPNQPSQKAWIKSNGVLKSVLKLPYLENFKEIPGLAINQAQLELPLAPGDKNGLNTPHPQLFLSVFNKDSNLVVSPDLLEGDNFFGGTLVGDKYVFRLTQYIQSVLRGDFPNLGIQIVARNSGITSNRSILSTENSLTSKPKLVFTYSTF